MTFNKTDLFVKRMIVLLIAKRKYSKKCVKILKDNKNKYIIKT